MTPPLAATHAEALHIAGRVKVAMAAESATIGFAFPDLDRGERLKAMAWAALQWAQGVLDDATVSVRRLDDEDAPFVPVAWTVPAPVDEDEELERPAAGTGVRTPMVGGNGEGHR